MKLYLYGIIDSSDQIKELIYGLEGAGVYNIPFCDIGVVVSEICRPLQDITEDAVFKHEAVVEKLMADFTALPLRFQTIVDSRDNLYSMMRSYYKDFKENLGRLYNKLEFGIKVVWRAEKIKENIIKTLEKDEQKNLESDSSQGKKFMMRKFEKYKINKEFQIKADKLIKAMDVFFSKFATEKKLGRLKTENLLLDAVYLIEKDNKGDFREAFEYVKSARPDLKYLFSGPWPPYNFVTLSKKSGLFRDHEQSNLFDKVMQSQILIGAASI
jgi:hypothetical protein